ncbi:MAG: putative glycoside hydrolase, partial [Fimbriimonas sp.]
MSRSSFHKLQIFGLSAIALGTLYSCAAPPEKTAENGEKPGKSTPPPIVEKKPEPPKIRYVKPEKVKGIYVTAWTAGGQKRMEQLLKLLDDTELNAMVIDIRDSGEMYFDTGIPLAKEVGANQIGVVNPKALMDRLEKRGVYPIARVACFRDVFVPKKMPDRGVQLPDGRTWKDHSGHSWLDPYNKKNWEYIADTVNYALDLGFPEIQLDYVRFPSEGKSSTQRFPAKKDYPDQKAKPEDVIAEFAKYIGEKVRAKGAVYSADIFGIISSGTKDQGIGQALEKIAEPFDLVCPMVYPSHYARGEYGIPNPNASPYAIIKKSLGDFKKRIPKKSVRPWLQ